MNHFYFMFSFVGIFWLAVIYGLAICDIFMGIFQEKRLFMKEIENYIKKIE